MKLEHSCICDVHHHCIDVLESHFSNRMSSQAFVLMIFYLQLISCVSTTALRAGKTNFHYFCSLLLLNRALKFFFKKFKRWWLMAAQLGGGSWIRGCLFFHGEWAKSTSMFFRSNILSRNTIKVKKKKKILLYPAVNHLFYVSTNFTCSCITHFINVCRHSSYPQI